MMRSRTSSAFPATLSYPMGTAWQISAPVFVYHVRDDRLQRRLTEASERSFVTHTITP